MRVMLLTGHNLTPPTMPGGYQNFAGRVGSGQEVIGLSSDGTGRVGSSRVRRFSNLAGRDRVTLTRPDPC